LFGYPVADEAGTPDGVGRFSRFQAESAASLPTPPPGGVVSADELLATRSAAASKLSTRPANATAGTQSPGRSYGVVRVAKRQ